MAGRHPKSGGPSRFRPGRVERVMMFILATAAVSFLAPGCEPAREEASVPSPDVSAMEPQVAEKIATAREAVSTAPRSHEAWGRLAIVFHAHRLERDAVPCYRRAAELAPMEFRWRYLLAHALRDTDIEAALAEAGAAARIRDDYAPTFVLRGQLLEASNRSDHALPEYQKAASLDENNALAEFGLGRLYLAQGELTEALGHLLRARELSEEAPAIRGALAQVYRRLGDQESALRENRIASEVSETIAIGDPVHYAMRKESVSSTAKLERAIEAEQAGDHETAESLYRELVSIRPHDAALHAKLGDILAGRSKLEEASVAYRAALAQNGQLAGAHYGLGNVLNFEGDYEGAAKHYRAALETRPDHGRALVNLAGILAFRGELEGAASLSRKALEGDPKGYAPNYQLGQILVQLGAFAAAIPPLQTALQTRPDSGPAHLQLGIALVAKGAYGEAWEHVQRAEQLGEKIPPSLVEELARRADRERG